MANFIPRDEGKTENEGSGVRRTATSDRVVREGLPEKADKHVQSRITLRKVNVIRTIHPKYKWQTHRVPGLFSPKPEDDPEGAQPHQGQRGGARSW